MDEKAAKLAERDLSGCCAMVIDPDPTSRSVLINQLRGFGVGEVAHFARVREARKFLESRTADFVLCEQDFRDESDYSGQDLLDDLRRAQLLPYSSVFIMVTGGATYAKVIEAAESSLDGYLLKPHKPSVLFERLMQARRRKIYLKPIFDPLDRDDYERAARVCELFFRKKATYGIFAARMGGEFRLRLGHTDAARQLFEEVVAEKGLPWAKLGVARALLDEGKTNQALNVVEGMLTEDPSYVDAYDVLGRIHVETGNFSQAIEVYRKATELTPGSIARVQKYGILSFYLGDYQTAFRTLSRCAILGSDSKMFDYQSFVLLGFCALYAKDRKVLTRCHDDLSKAAEQQPNSARLRRFKAILTILQLLINGKQEAATGILITLAGELPHAEFDFEAACNLGLLTAEFAALQISLPEAETWIRAIGMRYCRSRALTEQLGNTLRRHPPFQEVIKVCNSDVNAMAAQSMSYSLAGDHKLAVEHMMGQGQATLNAKFIENAFRVLQRYTDTENREALLISVNALRESLGVNQARDVIGRDTVRRAGATTLKAIAKAGMDEVNDAGPAFAN